MPTLPLLLHRPFTGHGGVGGVGPAVAPTARLVVAIVGAPEPEPDRVAWCDAPPRTRRRQRRPRLAGLTTKKSGRVFRVGMYFS